MPPISINVNVDLIDKKKLFKGKKGRYLDLVLWESEGTAGEEYGDYIVKQKGEKGDKLPILGNGKFFKKKDGAAKSKKPGAFRRGDLEEEDEDDDEDVF